MKSRIHDETAMHYVVAGNKLPTLLFVHGAEVVQDYRNAYQPMAIEIIEEIFNDGYKIERSLLPKLPCKLHLINVASMPTEESPLQEYAIAGYEVHHMVGTSHFPMIENPDEFNRKLDAVIEEIIQESNKKA